MIYSLAIGHEYQTENNNKNSIQIRNSRDKTADYDSNRLTNVHKRLQANSYKWKCTSARLGLWYHKKCLPFRSAMRLHAI